MCLCWCVLLKGLPSCKVSVLKESLKARRGCHRIINTCSLYNILHSRIRCANQAHLHSFPQISAWNVRCYQSVEALEFSFHSVWVTEACAKPLSWSAWFFFLCMLNICMHFYKHMPSEVNKSTAVLQNGWRRMKGPGSVSQRFRCSFISTLPSKWTTGDQNPPTTTI